MLEKVYQMKPTENHTEGHFMDAIVYREDVAILHELLPQGAEVPQHSVDYTVFIVLLKGAVEVRIGSQDWHAYRAGTVVEVPHGVPAGVRNQHPETAEFFVIKAGGKNPM